MTGSYFFFYYFIFLVFSPSSRVSFFKISWREVSISSDFLVFLRQASLPYYFRYMFIPDSSWPGHFRHQWHLVPLSSMVSCELPFDEPVCTTSILFRLPNFLLYAVLNYLSTTPWRHMEQWMYTSTFSRPRHWLEVSGQLHAPAALLPDKKPQVPIG
jgi:hypothetical protein